MTTALGKVASVSPGTLVPLTTDRTITATEIIVSQAPGQTGNVYLKKITGNLTMRAFLPTSVAGFLDEHRINGGGDGNRLYPADYAVDADTATMGLYVYWTTE